MKTLARMVGPDYVLVSLLPNLEFKTHGRGSLAANAVFFVGGFPRLPVVIKKMSKEMCDEPLRAIGSYAFKTFAFQKKKR